MKVLIACEFSGVVRDAFSKKGHDATSCDLLPTEKPGFHYQGDVFNLLYGSDESFDLVIAHPPCTGICNSGNRHYGKGKPKESQRKAGIDFFMRFVKFQEETGVDMAIENPVGVMSTEYRKPDQIIQPWMFGHPETKATCFWLFGRLQPLRSTKIVYEEMMRFPKKDRNKCHFASPGPNRGKIRSLTYLGIADAMAEQWG